MSPSKQRETRGRDEESGEATEAAQARKAERDQDVDLLLDEIDDVLEENAEAFVKGFVQKGGQ